MFFATCGAFGCLPLLQSNQLTQIVRSMFFEQGLVRGFGQCSPTRKWAFRSSSGLSGGSGGRGGIRRIGSVAARLVPGMILLYAAVSPAHSDAERNSSCLCSDFIRTRLRVGPWPEGAALVMWRGFAGRVFQRGRNGYRAMAHGRRQEAVRGLVAMWGPRDRYAAHIARHGVGSVGDRFAKAEIGPGE